MAIIDELQEQILKDLGYNFTFINFVEQGAKKNIKRIYRELKKQIQSLIFFKKALYQYFSIAPKMVKYVDEVDDCIRENIGFEVEKIVLLSCKKKCQKVLKK